MYQCTICKAEYQEKPDYCECGNDIFVFTETAKKDFFQYNKLFTKKNVSIFIFILCLILSILPWEISKKEPTKTSTSKATEKNINIPDIETFWDSTPPKGLSTIGNDNVITVYEKPKVAQKQPEKDLTATPQSVKPTHQKNSVPKAKNQTKSIKTQPKAQPKTQTNISKNNTKPIAKPVAEPVEKKQVKPKTEKVSKPITQAPRPIERMDSQEWLNYKNSLRYALLSKLDIVKISGEGDCAVSFSIAPNGKLLNRKFIYQSMNKSVNDQVYLMLMKLPTFKTPPKGYKGEIIKIKFYINNGYYEISFIN